MGLSGEFLGSGTALTRQHRPSFPSRCSHACCLPFQLRELSPSSPALCLSRDAQTPTPYTFASGAFAQWANKEDDCDYVS